MTGGGTSRSRRKKVALRPTVVSTQTKEEQTAVESVSEKKPSSIPSMPETQSLVTTGDVPVTQPQHKDLAVGDLALPPQEKTVRYGLIPKPPQGPILDSSARSTQSESKQVSVRVSLPALSPRGLPAAESSAPNTVRSKPTGGPATSVEIPTSFGTLHDNSVDLWPSTLTSHSKPALLLKLEAMLRDSGRMLSATEGKASTPDTVANLRLATVIACVEQFRKTFKIYSPIFDAFKELLNGVAEDVSTLQLKYSVLSEEFSLLNVQLNEQYTEAARKELELTQELKTKTKRIEELERIFVHEPAVYERMLRQQREAIEDGKKQIQQLTFRDNDLSAALVSRSMTIDNLEMKLFELARQREELLKESAGRLEEKRMMTLQMEQQEYVASQELSQRDAELHQVQMELLNVKSVSEAEIAKLKQQMESFRARTMSKRFLGDYDWSEMCDDLSNEDYYSHNEDGERLMHMGEMNLPKRIQHLVNLWTDAKDQLTRLDDAIQSGEYGGRGSPLPGLTLEGSSGLLSGAEDRYFLPLLSLQPRAAASGVPSPSSAQPVSRPTSPPPAGSSIVPGAKGENIVYPIDEYGTPHRKDVPSFLHSRLPGPVPGYDMGEGELVSTLQSFFDFHKKAVRSMDDPTLLVFDACFHQWIQTKHTNNYTKRLGFTYSFLYAVQVSTSRNFEVLLFNALLAGDAPMSCVMERANVILQLRSALERRMGTQMYLPLAAASATIRKTLYWLSEPDIQDLMAEVQRSMPPSKQTTVEIGPVFAMNSPFLRKLARHHLSRCIADGAKLRQAILSISPTYFVSAPPPSSGSAPASPPSPRAPAAPGGKTRPAHRGSLAAASPLPLLPHVKVGDVLRKWRAVDEDASKEVLLHHLAKGLGWTAESLSAALALQEKEEEEPPVEDKTDSPNDSPDDLVSPSGGEQSATANTNTGTGGITGTSTTDSSPAPAAPPPFMVDRQHLLTALIRLYYLSPGNTPVIGYCRRSPFAFPIAPVDTSTSTSTVAVPSGSPAVLSPPSLAVSNSFSPSPMISRRLGPPTPGGPGSVAVTPRGNTSGTKHLGVSGRERSLAATGSW